MKRAAVYIYLLIYFVFHIGNFGHIGYTQKKVSISHAPQMVA